MHRKLAVRVIAVAGAAVVLLGTHVPAHAQAVSARPRLLHPDSVAIALTKAWPVEYEKAAAGGMIRLRVFVDTLGQPDSTYVSASTGLERLDRAALAILRSQRFAPARTTDGVTGSWMELGLQFGDETASQRGAVLPAVVNRDEVMHDAVANAPRSLEGRLYRVPVPFLVTVHPDGRVASATTPEPGCFPDATEAAERVVRRLRFEPVAEGSPRRVTAVTVSYGSSVELIMRGDARPPATPTCEREPQPYVAGPDARPLKRPELANQQEVARALVRHYPPGLAARGIGGTPVVWFHINEAGRVTRLQVSQTSGICAFDVAAMDIGSMMRFTPALYDGEPVPIWVEIPIVFSAR